MITLGVISLVIINSFLPPLSSDDNMATRGNEDFVIAHFNVLMINEDHGSIMTQALNSNADLISFQEVNDRWADELDSALSCKFPYSYIVSRSNNYGIAVFSKRPFLEMIKKSLAV